MRLYGEAHFSMQVWPVENRNIATHRTSQQRLSWEIARKGLSALSRGGLQRGQVHLDHPHHRLHGFRVTDQFADIVWHNLPA